MGRRGGILQTLIRIERASQRQRAAQARAQIRAAREAERNQRAHERALVADEKERARIYAESRLAEAEAQNRELRGTLEELRSLLRDSLSRRGRIDLDALKEAFTEAPFEPGALGLALPAPRLENYLPSPLTALGKLIPGAKEKYERKCAEGRSQFEDATLTHRENERERREALEKARAEHALAVAEERRRVEAQHAEIEEFKESLRQKDPDAVASYFALVLQRGSYPEGFPAKARLAYTPASKQLVIEYELPRFEVVPAMDGFKYIKGKDEIAETPVSLKERRALYISVVAQTALRTLHEVFSVDEHDLVETVVFNGFVDALNNATGQRMTPCLVSVRAPSDTFRSLDLRYVDPAACLKALHASVSKYPEQLLPVRPVLEFNVMDATPLGEDD